MLILDSNTASGSLIKAGQGLSRPHGHNPALAYLARFSSKPGLESQRGSLRVLAEFLRPGIDPFVVPWERIGRAEALVLRQRLTERYAPATANRHLSALRGVLSESVELGLIDKVPKVENVKGKSAPAGREVPSLEVAELLAAIQDGPSGFRDVALLAVLWGCGLRRAEASALDVTDVQADGILVRRGKGNKARLVPMGDEVLQAVEEWLSNRGNEPGPLFCHVDKKKRVARTRRLTPQGVAWVLKRASERAKQKGFSPHDLRRSFITELLRQGADIGEVQRLAGHESVDTTLRYDKRGQEGLKRAVKVLKFPIHARKR